MIVLALDPGGTTGYAYRAEGAVGSGEIATPEAVWRFLEAVDADVVVFESFIYRPSKAHADLTGVEVIGIIKEWCRQRRVIYYSQRPDQAMHFFTDSRLAELGLDRPGFPHARDATRHLLYFEHFNPAGPRRRMPLQDTAND